MNVSFGDLHFSFSSHKHIGNRLFEVERNLWTRMMMNDDVICCSWFNLKQIPVFPHSMINIRFSALQVNLFCDSFYSVSIKRTTTNSGERKKQNLRTSFYRAHFSTPLKSSFSVFTDYSDNTQSFVNSLLHQTWRIERCKIFYLAFREEEN